MQKKCFVVVVQLTVEAVEGGVTKLDAQMRALADMEERLSGFKNVVMRSARVAEIAEHKD